MDREQTKREIRSRWRELIPELSLGEAKEKVNGEASYVCPLCNHGAGGDGLTFNPKSTDGNALRCFGCGFSGDIIDLYQKTSGTDYVEAVETLAERLRISTDTRNEQTAPTPAPAVTDQKPDLTAYIQMCASRLSRTDYLEQRGISMETAERFNLGFDPLFSAGGMNCAALIIPTGNGGIVARNTDPNAPKEYRYRKTGEAGLLNAEALLSDGDPLFIVEGELDALSIIEAGGDAVGLGSVANIGKLLKYIEGKDIKRKLLIALDADETGNEATDKLAESFEKLKVPFYRVGVYGEHKDANERLMNDKAGLVEAINRAKNIEKEEYSKTAALYQLQDFLNKIAASANATVIPTGFENLDKALDGGLHAGLYVVGAISSLGKTTFCLQIADQIASAGTDVLIFSLEMATEELIAKSVSRQTLLYDMAVHGTTAHAKSTRGVLDGSKYHSDENGVGGYTDKEKEIIAKAIQAYGSYAKNIYIKAGVGDFGINEVKETVKKHIELTGRKPVVLIDYLQILAPADPRATDKQNTDKAVLELKRMSRDDGIPVIAISSFNRENYNAPVNLTSFKESGAVEYSSDVLIGLQFHGMDYQEGENDKSREKRIRTLRKENNEKASAGNAIKIEVVILKNRNGSKGEAIFDFYPKFNYFKQGKIERRVVL